MSLNPILVPDDRSRFSITEGNTFVVDLSTIDPSGDVEGDGLTYSIVGGLDPEFFTLDSTTGRLSFITPPDFENPLDTGGDNVYNLIVQVTNSEGLFDIDRYAVVVLNDPGDDPEESPNVAPEAVDDTVDAIAGEPIEIPVLDNDSDPDGDSLTVDSFTQPENGTVDFIDEADPAQGVVFTADEDFEGTDSFTTTVSDGNGGTATSTVTIDVAPANVAPEAVDDTVDAVAGEPVEISVLDNDSDPDGDSLTVDSFTQPENGTVDFIDEADPAQGVVFTADEDFEGTDSFTTTISDGNGGTATSTVTVDVAPANEAPEAVDDTVDAIAGEPVEISVLDNDSDPDGDSLTVDSFTQPENGTVDFIDEADPAQGVVFTADEDFEGTDSFTTTISDGNGGTATSTVTVDVVPANEAPDAVDDSAEVFSGESVTISVLDNDSDPDGDVITISSFSQPENGTVDFVNGDDPSQGFVFTANSDFVGTDSFLYAIEDEDGAVDTAIVTVEVVPPPTPDAMDDIFRTSRVTTRIIDEGRTGISLESGRDVEFASFNGNEITAENAKDNGVHFGDDLANVLFDVSFDVLANDEDIPDGSRIQILSAQTSGLTGDQQYEFSVEDGTKLRLDGISRPQGRSNTPIVNSEASAVVEYAVVDANGDTLDTATFTLITESFLISSPIAFDLGGDGIQTISVNQGVQFDLLNTGYTVTTGWLSGDDAFLATDDNGNGIIDDRSELFGGGVGEGFAELATFDSNNDGVVNAEDDRFGELLIWQDFNEDGITDEGELITLESSAIASISTGYTDVFSLDSQGNVHGEVGSASLADGSSIDVVDVYFQYEPNTVG